MSQGALGEVFTADEIARAAGVASADVQACLAAGEIRTIPGTPYISGADAIRLGRRLKSSTRPARERRAFMAAACASSAVHAALVALVVWLSAGAARMEAVAAPPAPPARLVFLLTPGPGGGGGGGGLRSPRPAPRVLRRTRPPAPAPEPEPVARPVDPAPAVNAPLVETAAEPHEPEELAAGSGAGSGSGVDEGFGGGADGGPYRPGSGIEPPRLLREVKAVYTEEARRRGLTGDVLLEIVVRRDGSVGNVSVIRALGAGLEERAIEAVRQWRFAPARRLGVAIDVIVEVAVEFTLR
jgi:protein TonB